MENKAKDQQQIKSLLILYSYHHHNTEKIAKMFAEVLNAQIKMPKQINPEELQDYDLIGFGSGIYSSKHTNQSWNLQIKSYPLRVRKHSFFQPVESLLQ